MQYLRQLDLLTPGDLAGLDVDIVGAGALGGAILLCLGKMGFGVANSEFYLDPLQSPLRAAVAALDGHGDGRVSAEQSCAAARGAGG